MFIRKFSKIFLLWVVCIFAFHDTVVAQVISGETYLDELNAASIKSLDEFILRFNTEDVYIDTTLDSINVLNPESPLSTFEYSRFLMGDSNASDSLRLVIEASQMEDSCALDSLDLCKDTNIASVKVLRTRYLLSTFDRQRFLFDDSSTFSSLQLFIETVSRNNIRLNLDSGRIYAEAQCHFKYRNKNIPINIVLFFENIRDDYYKWAIVGANGLFECGLLDTIRTGHISPIQHEVHFLELSRACDAGLLKYLSVNRNLDQLSFLLGLLKTKQIKFVDCSNVLFYVLDVPDYIFVVEKQNRLSLNSGLLISSLFRMEESDKDIFLKYLLGSGK